MCICQGELHCGGDLYWDSEIQEQIQIKNMVLDVLARIKVDKFLGLENISRPAM